jgi:hypothetical protein
MVTLPASSTPALPENKTSSKSLYNNSFSALVVLLKVDLILGKILSMSLSTALDKLTALVKSLDLFPICSRLVKKASSGISPLGLNL